MALETGYELVEDPSQRRCYVCRVDVSGELIRKDFFHGVGDGPEVSERFYLSLCSGHEDMDTWPWDLVAGFYQMASEAMGVPSPFD